MRNPPGRVRDAIVHALNDGEASVKEILTRVELQLPEVASSSVRSYLRLNAGRVFVQSGRGRYRLMHESIAAKALEVEFPSVKIGQSSLFQGDCISWLRRQPASSIHAVVTDPPYSVVEYTQPELLKLRSGRGGVWRVPPSFDGHKRSPLPRFTTMSRDDIDVMVDFFREWSLALLPTLVPGAHVFIASNPLLSHLVGSVVAQCGFERRGEIARLVMTMRGGDRPKNAHEEFTDVSVMPRSMWEPWLLFRKPIEGRVQDNLRKWKTGGLRRISAERPFGDVIRSAPTQKSEREIAPHPSLKPQAFLRSIVRAALPLGEGTVLDPFAGSGSTLAAAEAIGYRSIGVELDVDYFDVAKLAIPRLARLSRSDES